MSSVLDREPRNREQRPRIGPSPEQSKVLVLLALRPVGVLAVLVAAVIAVTLVSANSDLTGLFGAVGATWLAVHQVPLGIGGADIGILPLLPTLLLILVVARGCAKALAEDSSASDIAWVVAAAVGGPLLMAAVMLAVVQDASSVLALSTPNALATFGAVLAVHAVGAVIGVVRGIWPAMLRRVDVQPWVISAFAPAAAGFAALCAGGALVVAASLVASWSTIDALLESAGGTVGALGLTIVSLLYLPNVVIGAAAVVTGSTAHVGAATVGMFGTVGGPVPAVPVLAALPEGSAARWWPAMAVVAVIAAVVLGRACAKATISTVDAFRSAAIASVIVSASTVVVGFVAGGTFGKFGEIGVDVGLFGAASFAWMFVVGGGTAALTGYLAHRHEDSDQWLDHPDPVEPQPEPLAIEPAAAEMVDAEVLDVGTDVIDAEVVETDVVETEVVDADVVDAEVVDAEVVETDTDADPNEARD